MIKNKMMNQGFGAIAIVLIAAVVLAGGAGTYYISTKKSATVETMAETPVETTTMVTSEKSQQSLRSLMGLGKNLQCTFTSVVANSSSSGTVYISGTDLRGDFVTKVNGATIDSHMIRLGETMYVWSSAQGSQGVKMKATSDMEAKASQQGGVSLDQQLDYTCSDWNKDGSKFVVPASITFIDLEAMMQGGIQIPGGAKIDMNVKAGVVGN